MATKRKPSSSPSQTYAARAARGNPIVTIAMTTETKEELRAMATKSGLTLGAMVAWLLKAVPKGP